MDKQPSLIWFSRVVWLGIAANLCLALPLLFAPAFALGMFQLPIPDQLVWPRLSGLLVCLLSALYLPAAIDPKKLGKLCWLLVATRALPAAFFFIQGGQYLPFGVFDTTFGIVLATLLYRSEL
jgi:hypothetical protein